MAYTSRKLCSLQLSVPLTETITLPLDYPDDSRHNYARIVLLSKAEFSKLCAAKVHALTKTFQNVWSMLQLVFAFMKWMCRGQIQNLLVCVRSELFEFFFAKALTAVPVV